MALKIRTSDPNALLKAIKKAIDDKKVLTWSYDSEGDFTHTAEQWKSKAWLRPKVNDGELLFTIMKPEKTDKVSDEIYGIYHGRFVEMVLAHFRSMFREIVVTSA